MNQICRDVIEFPGFVDTMYRNTPNELVLDNGFGTKLSIRNEGFVSFSNFFFIFLSQCIAMDVLSLLIKFICKYEE